MVECATTSFFWRTGRCQFSSEYVVIIATVLFVEPVRDRVFSIFAGRADSSNNFRINVWAAVVEMIRDRPILGIGPATPPSTKFTHSTSGLV